MARHAVPRHRPAQRTALRAGLALSVTGLALGAAGAATATAGPLSPAPAAGTLPLPDKGADAPTAARATGQAASLALHRVVAPAKGLRLDPLAGTGMDPLDNSVGTQVADFKPVSTSAVTGPLARGGSLESLPVVGQAADRLPG